MSKFIGKIHSSERNEASPGFDVAASRAGIEIHSDQFVTLQPSDARTFAALLLQAADTVERMQARAQAEADCCRSKGEKP